MTTCHVGGRYRLDVRDPATGVTRSTGWFDNLITDHGLDMMGQGPADYLRYCQVGTGTAAPAAGDVALGAGVASGTATYQDQRFDTTDRYIVLRLEYLFAAGSVDASVTEVGVGPVNDALSTSLFSRALTPGPVAVGASEELVVYYEFRVYQPMAESLFTVDGIEVAVSASAIEYLYYTSGWWLEMGHPRMVFSPGTTTFRFWENPLEATSIAPAGSISQGVTGTDYVPGSFERALTLTLAPDQGAGSYQSMGLRCGPAVFRFNFTPALEKSEYQELVLTLIFRWARRP